MVPPTISAMCDDSSRTKELDVALVRGDVVKLRELGVTCAETVFSGHVASFDPNVEHEPVRDITDAVCGTVSVDASQLQLKPADYYVAGVRLLNTFLRLNFAGPPDAYGATDFRESGDSSLLSIDGEDAPSSILQPSLLICAKCILVEHVSDFVSAGFAFAPWWAARAALAHHVVLDKPAPSLQAVVLENYAALLGSSSSACRTLTRLMAVRHEEDGVLFPSSNGETASVFHDPATVELAALAYLELCNAQQSFHDVQGALNSLQCASDILQITLHLEGQLGVRTKYQADPVSQLVARAVSKPGSLPRKPHHVLSLQFARAERTLSPVPSNCATTSIESLESSPQIRKCTSLPLPANCPLDDSDVLGYVKYVPSSQNHDKNVGVAADDSNENIEQVELLDITPVEQCLLLSHANLELARTSTDALSHEQAAPFVQRVLDSAETFYGTSAAVQIHALMMRAEFESSKGRYMERNIAQLEVISTFIDSDLSNLGLHDTYVAASERNVLVFACGLSPKWEIKKKLASAFGRFGLVKSAMKIYEEMGCWDELVDCHRLIGNLGTAESLVREQLSLLVGNEQHLQSPYDTDNEIQNNYGSDASTTGASSQTRKRRRPRLLCVLGDVTRNVEYYVQAWNESGCCSARAKRSLGRYAFLNGNLKEALEHYRAALKLNPLFPEVWFTCGCAAIELRDMTYASICFTRVVQESPDNGEAWNNLGRVLSELGKHRESLTALNEASRCKRDSWRVWENVLLVATQLRSSKDIVRALDRLLDLRGEDGVVTSAIEVAVDDILDAGRGHESSFDNMGTSTADRRTAVGRTCRSLLEILARATSLISTEPALWAVYARLQSLIPGIDSAHKTAEFRQRQIRSQILKSDWKCDTSSFRAMSVASLDFAIAAITAEDGDLMHAAELHVNSVMRQTKETFAEHDGFAKLIQAQAMLSAELGP